MYKKGITGLLLASALTLASCSGGDETGCPKVKDAVFNVTPTAVNLTFEPAGDANSFRIEYGATGFMPGSGTAMTTSSNNVTLANLSPATTYDVYITSICSSESSSKPFKLSSVTTDPSQCTGTASAQLGQFDSSTVDIYLQYSGGSPDKYEVEYGLNGFTRGTGTKMSTSTGSNSLEADVEPDTQYDFYVRAVCYQTDASAWVKYDFTTQSGCPAPTNLNSYNISGACNVGMGETRAFTWTYLGGNPTSYTISIVTAENINSPGTGSQEETSNTSIAFSGMYCLWEAFYVKANCIDGSSSEWAGPFYF